MSQAIQTTNFEPKLPLKPFKGVKRGDYPLVKLFDAQTFLDRVIVWMKESGIRYASFQDLYMIYRAYCVNDSGITRYALLSSLGCSAGSYRALSDRLLLLRKRGFVVCVDGLYYPTELAIEEFGKLLS